MQYKVLTVVVRTVYLQKKYIKCKTVTLSLHKTKYIKSSGGVFTGD